MKKIIKNTILYSLLISLALFSAPVLAEEVTVDEEAELRERMDTLIEKAKELVELAQELEEQGKLPLVEEVDCDLYLETYIKFGADNSVEDVERLQTFLNDYEGEELPVTGFYGEMTKDAVNRLQEKYADKILTPWGITQPTGFVYKTTRAYINNVKCPDVVLPTPDVTEETGEDVPEIAGEVTETDETTTEEGVEEGEDSEDWIDENWEELREEDEEEGEKGNTLAWMLVIIGSIGLGIVVYNIVNYKKEDQR